MARCKQSELATLVESHYLALRRIASRLLRDQSYSRETSPTSLVAESVIRLLRQRNQPCSVDHLRGLATVFMTRVLLDASKHRRRVKRGAGTRALPLPADDVLVALASTSSQSDGANNSSTNHELDALRGALESLALASPRQAEALTLHVVAGIPLLRTADLLGISHRTAARDVSDGAAALTRLLGE